MRVQSSVPGSEWPAVPGPDGARLLAMQYQFQQSERLPPAQLQQRQLEQAGRVLQHAVKTVPWYRRWYAELGVRPRHVPDLARWLRLPVLTRELVQDAGDSLRSTADLQGHGKRHLLRSSGSTGRPVEAQVTDLVQLYWQAITLREHLWHQRDLNGVLAAIRVAGGDHAQGPEGVQAQGWGPAVDAVTRAGRSALLSITQPLPVQLAWLQQLNPDYLITFPSNAAALLALAAEQGVQLPALKEVRCVGEVVPQALRSQVRELWGLPVVDTYSAQETGYLALQCPEQEGHYHVQSESVLLEVLDSNGQPCQPGQIGQVLVTTLHNFAMPLIRYQIGDLAAVGGPCGCGRTLPVLTRILGRTRNMVQLPDGSSHWPFMGEKRFTEVAPVQQFQLVQHSLSQVEARLVVPAALSREQEQALAQIIQQELRHPFEVSFSYPEAIERSAGGKFEDFVCAIPAGSAAGSTPGQ